MRGTLHSAALHASPLRDPWPGELWCFDGSCHGSMTEENIDVLLVWRRFVQDWSRFRLRSGDMDQLYGATLLPFGALCLVFLWESAASSIRTTLSVDTSRWVWRSAGWGIGHLFKGCWVFLDHDAQPSILTRVKTSLLVTLWPAEWTVREWYNDKETPGWTPGISFNLKGFLGSEGRQVETVTACDWSLCRDTNVSWAQTKHDGCF